MVERYLSRSGASGGGSKSIPVLSKALFKTEFHNLKQKQKRIVIAEQVQRQTWRNDFVQRSIFSTACLKFIHPKETSSTQKKLRADDS